MLIFGEFCFGKDFIFRRRGCRHHVVEAVAVIEEIKGECFIFICLLRVVTFQKPFLGASGTFVGL